MSLTFWHDLATFVSTQYFVDIGTAELNAELFSEAFAGTRAVFIEHELSIAQLGVFNPLAPFAAFGFAPAAAEAEPSYLLGTSQQLLDTAQEEQYELTYAQVGAPAHVVEGELRLAVALTAAVADGATFAEAPDYEPAFLGTIALPTVPADVANAFLMQYPAYQRQCCESELDAAARAIVCAQTPYQKGSVLCTILARESDGGGGGGGGGGGNAADEEWSTSQIVLIVLAGLSLLMLLGMFIWLARVLGPAPAETNMSEPEPRQQHHAKQHRAPSTREHGAQNEQVMGSSRAMQMRAAAERLG